MGRWAWDDVEKKPDQEVGSRKQYIVSEQVV